MSLTPSPSLRRVFGTAHSDKLRKACVYFRVFAERAQGPPAVATTQLSLGGEIFTRSRPIDSALDFGGKTSRSSWDCTRLGRALGRHSQVAIRRPQYDLSQLLHRAFQNASSLRGIPFLLSPPIICLMQSEGQVPSSTRRASILGSDPSGGSCDEPAGIRLHFAYPCVIWLLDFAAAELAVVVFAL
jgi:hypothetical protein